MIGYSSCRVVGPAQRVQQGSAVPRIRPQPAPYCPREKNPNGGGAPCEGNRNESDGRARRRFKWWSWSGVPPGSKGRVDARRRRGPLVRIAREGTGRRSRCGAAATEFAVLLPV